MQALTPHADQTVQNLAQRYGVSTDAVRTLLVAVSNGGGTMAQFYHAELGGGGQWMQGGMTMVGDMFNSGLQSRVSGLCSELSGLLNSGPVFAPLPQQGNTGFNSFASSNWWPAELGSPSSSGGQNSSRYAYFPQARRLAIESFGQVTLYDTLDHQIGGVQQQQGGNAGSLSFSSQFGTFTVDSLPRAAGSAPQYVNPAPPPPVYAPAYTPEPAYVAPSANNSQSTSNPQSTNEILAAIERLGQLHQQGVLQDDEFRQKKAELLSRL